MWRKGVQEEWSLQNDGHYQARRMPELAGNCSLAADLQFDNGTAGGLLSSEEAWCVTVSACVHFSKGSGGQGLGGGDVEVKFLVNFS